ncbi:MAG: 4-hydroxy-3-methylbut-2-enyl diphosphate reductase [Bacteroides sp.]|nr:4-hydroxy-3-methylbut-2-enyl diphosphate reductase [Bacteroides sp.]MCM1414194.1 4-hydroxy-3-methylbut-2-enyl diphosphate reductase [Bacteroides sp.]MCM1472016.1 4-hydroxy-3-methylbut-2-enyl diphosphate reductase [Bacteroides sp.]
MTDHRNITIDIDADSGFCFGVTSAISKAEAELSSGHTLYCLGDIVHNSDEVERLRCQGLVTISHADLSNLAGAKVMLRAHGEPPSTYAIAAENNIEIIDATCPVVLQLQRRIKATYSREDAPQIVIYGKAGHAEVNGLVGQTQGTAIVVESADQLSAIDFSRPIAVYSQTTKPLDGFRNMCNEIISRASDPSTVECHDTICRRVSNRVQGIRQFASDHDVVLFVAGKKSSNGRVLFNQCHDANHRSHLIANATEIEPQWLADAESIGIAGATSTPRWLMEDVKKRTEQIVESIYRC